MSRNGVRRAARPLRRVLILADASAHWQIAGLRQLDRLLLLLQEFALAVPEREPISVCVFWEAPAHADGAPSLDGLHLSSSAEEFLQNDRAIDLVVSTRLFLYRDSIPRLLAGLPAVERNGAHLWADHALSFDAAIRAAGDGESERKPWKHLASRREIPACERRFLRYNGKSQDGLVSRHVNRPLSRSLTRWLLKLPLVPSVWSALIFALPVAAAFAFLEGTYLSFIIGATIFQLYSVLDGCDGEIARAKFLQSDFGRRLDSFCDLLGNVLLALTLGIGLSRQAEAQGLAGWFYITEGIAAALLILLSEGIVFVRRTRSAAASIMSTKWRGALYQRHHEFIERSGILVLGEKFAWGLVQLTKRDMAMLAFLFLAILGWPQCILHLLLIVSGISSWLASNAFLRQPAPVMSEEAG